MHRRALFAFVAAAVVLGCGSSGTPAAPDQGGTGTFELLFRDEFDALDQTRWQLMTHSWDTNLALFATTPVTVENGSLVIRLLPAPEGTVDSGGVPKQFLGAEVRSKDT